MKKGIVYIILIAAILPFAACKEDVPTLFSSPDGIYFSATSDSLFYSFAKYPSRIADTLKIPITVLGNAVNTDRQINVEKVSEEGINATEGVHYKLLPPYTMPAGQISTTIPVAIYKTGDMDSILFNFKLKLTENENFVSGISAKAFLKIKLSYLQKPPTWGEFGGSQWAGYSTNFGTWTKTKYKVVLQALYDPVSDTTVSEFPYLRFGPPAISIQYLQLVKNYIRTNYPGNYSTPLGVGPTLRDPDANNNVIQVGPANY
jgi:Domain of unknown function (DUF4843)